MNKISCGSARYPEGGINTGFNPGHEVGDGALFDVILLIMFNPEISGGRNTVRFLWHFKINLGNFGKMSLIITFTNFYYLSGICFSL